MKNKRVGIDCYDMWFHISQDDEPPSPPAPSERTLTYWENLLEVEKGKRSFVTIRRMDVMTGNTKVVGGTLRGRKSQPKPPTPPSVRIERE